ncbi:MAG: hypothetical protein KDB53_20025 [Planctomycetes bacterium]|nr:hypothetical protein [Planctomycetota bacterium]
MQPPSNSEGGATLVEVAVAITVVAILAFGVLLGFTTAGVQDRSSYELTRSQNVCTALIEQVESMSFDELLALAGPAQDATPVGGKWQLQVRVTEVQRDLLSIECSSQVQSDGSHFVSLVTLKSKKGENL